MIYQVFSREIVSDFIIQDAICKGYSIHSSKALVLWELLLNRLLECFSEELGEIKIVNTVPQIIISDFLTDFYRDRFCRIEDRIPRYKEEQDEKSYIATDELPFLFSNLDKGNTLFSAYTVVRPRAFAVKPYLREEFIRYFQFVISADENSLDDVIRRIQNAACRFFEKIRVSVVLVDRHSDSYYEKKSCFHAVWLNGNVESVLQCGILKKRFESASGKSKVVIDVGGAQRLLASFLYANSDSYGLFLPYDMRDYDVVVSGGEKTEVLDAFIKEAEKVGCRIKLQCDHLPLKKGKRSAIEESALALVAKRKIGGKDFLTVYNRDMTKTDFCSPCDIKKWFEEKYRDLEQRTCEIQTEKIQSKIKDGKLYYKSGDSSYEVIEDGLFR